MVDYATAEYLRNNVGGVLAKAMAEMAVAQPSDGVDFLAQWLKQYALQEEAKALREEEERALEEERSKTKAKRAEKEAKLRLQEGEAQARVSLYKQILSKFEDSETVFSDSCWSELVDACKAYTGASAVYLGLLDDEPQEGENACISYEYASAGSEWMTDKVLPKDVGVTWGALLENPPQEAFQQARLWRPPRAEPAVEVQDGDDPPPEKPQMPYFPVYVDSVTDTTEVHYFDMTRLGAYLAVPLVYTCYTTSESLADARQYFEDLKAEEKRREEAALATPEDGADPPEPPPPVEEKPMVLRGKVVKMVLCLDTLGTSSKFEESHILELIELCKACGSCKSQTDTKQVAEQARLSIDEELRQGLTDQITQARGELERALQEALEEEQAAAEEDAKDLLDKKYGYNKAREAFLDLRALVLDLRFSWVVVPPEVNSVIMALALLLGYPKERVYPRRKTVLRWDVLKLLLDEELCGVIQSTEIVGPRHGLPPEHKLSFVQKLAFPADFDAAKAREVSPAFEVISTLVQAAVSYRAADLEHRKADYLKQKEEAAEAWSGPPLEDLDDDFVE